PTVPSARGWYHTKLDHNPYQIFILKFESTNSTRINNKDNILILLGSFVHKNRSELRIIC
ncbi:MAG: hypothetical protein ACXW1A_04625, partial [Nitrososphaeraceae archaeon]